MQEKQYCHWRQEDGIWYIVGPPNVVRVGAEVEVKTKEGSIQNIKIESLGPKIIGWGGEVLQVGIPEPFNPTTRTITERQVALVRQIAKDDLDLYESVLAGRSLAALTMDEANEIISSLLDAQQSDKQ
jgi:hypothetical protein